MEEFDLKRIFEQGEFDYYRLDSLNESRGTISEYRYDNYGYSQKVTTVFLSHKHDELTELKNIVGFLQEKYGVKVYIDSNDSSMPIKTSGKTAETLKVRIKQCRKFILLATNDAINSKWCNWELGYGDAHKFSANIALFPIKPKGKHDYEYGGNEYLSIYPYIAYYDGTEKYTNGTLVSRGYYVCTEDENGRRTIVPLGSWFNA